MTRHMRHQSATLAVATAVVAGALVSTALTTAATAQPTTGRIHLAAAPTALSAAARTTLIQQAQADAAGTAQAIGLGAKEK
ncbi:peptidase M4 family protein, partial [Streptomyces sp. NPDC005728]